MLRHLISCPFRQPTSAHNKPPWPNPNHNVFKPNPRQLFAALRHLISCPFRPHRHRLQRLHPSLLSPQHSQEGRAKRRRAKPKPADAGAPRISRIPAERKELYLHTLSVLSVFSLRLFAQKPFWWLLLRQPDWGFMWFIP